MPRDIRVPVSPDDHSSLPVGRRRGGERRHGPPEPGPGFHLNMFPRLRFNNPKLMFRRPGLRHRDGAAACPWPLVSGPPPSRRPRTKHRDIHWQLEVLAGFIEPWHVTASTQVADRDIGTRRSPLRWASRCSPGRAGPGGRAASAAAATVTVTECHGRRALAGHRHGDWCRVKITPATRLRYPRIT